MVDRLASLAGRADQGTWCASFADVLPGWFKTFVGLEGLARPLDETNPLQLHADVEEAVLHRVAGGPEVM